jgi:hypothetical protein
MKPQELPDYLRRATQERLAELVDRQANRVQGVYDVVLHAGRGRSLDDVKELLAREWRTAFGTELTEPKLSELAAPLAEGRRIVVKARASVSS